MKQSVLQKLQVASKLRHQPKQVSVGKHVPKPKKVKLVPNIKTVVEKPKVLTFEEKQAKAKAMVKLYNLEA